MGKTALLAAGGGGLSGAAVLAALAGSPLGVVLFYFAPLPLLFVGLGFGSSVFGFAAAAGLAVAVAFGGFAGAGLYGGMHVIPSWLIVQQALRRCASSPDGWQPIGRVLAALTLLIAFVVASTTWVGRGAAGIEGEVRELLTTVGHVAAPGLDEADHRALVDRLTPLFLGFSAITWLVMMIVNSGLAQSLLAARGWNRRPRPRWSQLRLPGWFDWVLVATAATALVADGDAGFLARNIVMILLTPYFFVGLAVTHLVLRRAPMPVLALGAFYGILLVFFLIAGGIVAAIGVVEQWIGLRDRLAVAGPSRRSE
jgi:Predicted membrane protein (DUF2232)